MKDFHKQINMVKSLPNIPSFLLLPVQFLSLSLLASDCLKEKWRNSSFRKTKQGHVLCKLSHLLEF